MAELYDCSTALMTTFYVQFIYKIQQFTFCGDAPEMKGNTLNYPLK